MENPNNEFIEDCEALLGDMIEILIPDSMIDKDQEWFSIDKLVGNKVVIFSVKPVDGTICGIIIGKRGFTIDSIRDFMNAVASIHGFKFNIVIEQPSEQEFHVEEEVPNPLDPTELPMNNADDEEVLKGRT